MVSPSKCTSSDLSIVKVFTHFEVYTEYHELKLFWVYFDGIDFKPVQKFTSIMLQIL